MKYLLFLTLIVSQTLSFAQKADTIKVYDYANMPDQWKLKIQNEKNFTFTNVKSGDSLMGELEILNNSVGFVIDTNLNKVFIKTLKSLQNGVKLRYAKCFGKEIPLMTINKSYYRGDTTMIPTGIFATYYRGTGYVSYHLTLNEDYTYTIREWSDMGGNMFGSKGVWKAENDLIRFTPEDNSEMLSWFTENNTMQLVHDLLIGLKTNSIANFYSETYYYFLKRPARKSVNSPVRSALLQRL